MLGIFLDLETTGLDTSKHRVLEIAFKVLQLSTGEELARYESVIKQPRSTWEASDPDSLHVNGFTYDRLEEGKDEACVGEDIVSLLNKLHIKRGSAVFICQNPSFDRGFFAQLVKVYRQESYQWPYHWLDFASMYWALKISREGVSTHLPLSKDSIAKDCGLPPEPHPHRAMNGVDHLILCYQKLLNTPSLSIQSEALFSR